MRAKGDALSTEIFGMNFLILAGFVVMGLTLGLSALDKLVSS
jgi:hypothetical protein